MNSADTMQLEQLQIPARLKYNRKGLDDLIAIAADMLEMPLAIVLLPGYDKRYLSKTLKRIPDGTETSFCRSVEHSGTAVIIPDLQNDENFKGKFFSHSMPSVRFCAGIPLISQAGTVWGSIGFFDIKPRLLSGRQKKALNILAAQITRLIESDMMLQLIKRQETEIARLRASVVTCERKLKAFFKSSAFCHMLIGKDLEVLDFNKAAAIFVKQMCDEPLQTGKRVLEYISAQHKGEFMICLTKAFSGRRIHKEILVKFEKKEPAWWSIYLEPVKDDEGKVIGVVFNATDINDQKEHIAEITAKNELLSHIAYIQSHEYRRPVASILGLMEVLRMQKQPLSEELQMMDVAVKELDQQIRSVINFTQILSASK